MKALFLTPAEPQEQPLKCKGYFDTNKAKNFN